MCAINGFNFQDRELILRMNRVLSHRGPDGTDFFLSPHATLGHNRLSIIDIDARANQPMVSASGRYTIVFNGEIYNFYEIKLELNDYPYKTASDTEVILAAIEKWGIEAICRLNGMFALAIYDNQTTNLILARDPAGIKPLYYYNQNGIFIFSSEIKGILEHPVPRILNPNALETYLRLLYMPGPETFFKDIYSLPAGSIMTVKRDGSANIEPFRFKGKSKKLLSNVSLVEGVRTLTEESINRQLISDRPVGIYLSGGIDSSIVLHSVAQGHSNVNTFSVGFRLSKEEQEEKFNSDFYLARETANRYGTKHHEVLFDADIIPEVLENVVWHQDQPISNATMLPMHALSLLAKKDVAVVLTGDGGDELFGGYERYRYAKAALLYQNLPISVRNIFSRGNKKLQQLNTPAGLDLFKQFMYQKDQNLNSVLIEKIHDKYADKVFEKYFNSSNSFLNSFLKADLQTWLVDEALARTDRMSMAGSIEARAPLLDLELLNFASEISVDKRISLWKTKPLLKNAFADVLPKYLLNQPKRGWFSPGAKWLRRSDLRDYFLSVLQRNYYQPTATLFDWDCIDRMWTEHQAGKYHYNALWAVIIFQLWAKRFSVTV